MLLNEQYKPMVRSAFRWCVTRTTDRFDRVVVSDIRCDFAPNGVHDITLHIVKGAQISDNLVRAITWNCPCTSNAAATVAMALGGMQCCRRTVRAALKDKSTHQRVAPLKDPVPHEFFKAVSKYILQIQQRIFPAACTVVEPPTVRCCRDYGALFSEFTMQGCLFWEANEYLEWSYSPSYGWHSTDRESAVFVTLDAWTAFQYAIENLSKYVGQHKHFQALRA